MSDVRRSCADVDPVGAAYALGALPTDELRAVAAHLESCDQPHTQLRELVAVARALPESLEPIEPSPRTLDRILASVAAIQPAQPAPVVVAAAARRPPRRAVVLGPSSIWRTRVGALAALSVALAVAVTGLTAWNLRLRSELERRQEQLAAAAAVIADADAAYRVEGSAGSGYLLATQTGSASLVVTDVAQLRAGQLYAMWLLSDAGTAPAGTFAPAAQDDVVVATVEHPLTNYARFIVTVETSVLDEPTTESVIAADLER
ncbi:MAG: anti-sigma factor [Chloroflexota bacterium]|nr:anti-sigma factor [Chloroflexota bacterium]